MIDMSEKPKVLVLLAAYNGIDWLNEQIESILNQKDVVVQIVVSIDPSSDGTQEYFEKLALKDNRVSLLSTGQKFGGAAPNFFRLIYDVDFSNFDFISLADQDDIWKLDKLSRACKLLHQSDYDGYSSNVTAFWPDGRESLVSKAQKQTKYDYLFESPGPGCTFVFSYVLASKIKDKIIQDYDQIHMVWLHDWFCYSYSRFNGYKWIIDERPSMFYRQHEKNQVGANFGWKPLVSRAKVIVSGDGFHKVLNQAYFLGQNDMPPIDYLRNGNRISFLKLAAMAFSCRRKKLEKIFFLAVSIIFFIKGSR
jgi:rhamnosyltransferase